MDSVTTQDLDTAIREVAESIKSQWPDVIGADDAAQEIWVHLLERPGTMDKLLALEKGPQKNVLVRIGHQVASEYRASYEVFSGNYRYGVNEVKSLLGSGVLKSERVEINIERMDLEDGLTALARKNKRHADLVCSRYAFDETISTSDKDALSRALESLTDLMNRAHRARFADEHDGPGARRVMTNAKAQAITTNQWSE